MPQHTAIAKTNRGAPLEELPKLIIRRQLTRSGNTLMAAMEPLTADEFYKPGPSGISAAWTMGHIACVADLFAAALEGGELALDAETHEVFNSLEIAPKRFSSKAEGVDPAKYPKASILLMVRQTQVRLLQILDVFEVERWNDPAPDRMADVLPTLGAVWEHLAVHVYWHLGELSSAVERFYGTYSMNSMLHYFAWGENNTQAARAARAAAATAANGMEATATTGASN